MYKLLLLLLVITISYIGCQKNNSTPPDNPYGLPNATQTGENMFACRVNGKNYIVSDPNSYTIGISFHNNNTRDTLGVGASGSFTDTSITRIDEVWIQIDKQVKEGDTYRLNDTATAFALIHYQSAPCGPTSGYGGSQWLKTYDGDVTISKFSGTYRLIGGTASGYDPNSIIAGTFNFMIAVPGCDTIKVTDGRFDINYSQL